MRPYIEVIIDSFRAAMATRVLYVMLALITVFLVLFGPLGLKEDISWSIRQSQNSLNGQLVVKRLVEGSENENRPDIQRIWNKLPAADQDSIRRLYDDQKLDVMGSEQESVGGEEDTTNPVVQNFMLLNVLNSVIDDIELYEPDTWNERALPLEAKELIDTGVSKISDKRKKRLNRLLVEQSLGRDAVFAASPTSIQLYYLFWKLDFFPGLSKSQVHSFIADWLPFIFDKFVMSIGLLIAILLTSSIVPDTFEPGSLNLLLSKPITRWGLLIAKFIGGCAFIFLCAVYLFVGVWLILGFRWDFWNQALLYSIPLYLLVFAIYYSISMMVGIWKRSPVLSVICTLLFWAMCYAIGVAHNSFSDRMRVSQITDVASDDDRIVGIDRFGFANIWENDSQKWKVGGSGNTDPQVKALIGTFYGMSFFDWMLPGAIEADFMPAFAPIFDAKSNTFILPQKFDFTNPSQPIGTPVLNQITGSTLTSIGPAHKGLIALLPDSKNGPLVVTRSGAFFRLNIDAAKAAADKAKSKNESAVPTVNKTDDNAAKTGDDSKRDDSKRDEANSDDSKSEAPKPELTQEESQSAKKPYVRIGPNKASFIRDPSHVSMNIETAEVAMFGRKRIRVYKLGDDGKYTFDREGEIDPPIDVEMTAWLKFFGDKIALGLGNGNLLIFDAAKLTLNKEIASSTRSAISQINGSRDGKWLTVIYRDGSCWRMDADSGDTLEQIQVGDKVSHVDFDSNNDMWVAHDINFLTRYDSELNAQDSVEPKLGFVGKAYYYVLRPLYVVCPKPGEFYKLVTHLTSEDSKDSVMQIDRTKLPEPTNPWSPLVSGLAFMAFILLLSCLMFQRTDY